MRTVFQRLLVVSVLMTALVACLNTPPMVVPPIDETPIKSGFGTPVGSALTQTIVASGGSFSEATTGATVKAFAGTVDASAQVKVQPITNTLPDGIGMGVEISSNQPLKKPLIVRFSYDAREPDPNSLRLALQADDGAWWSLSPVKVDTVNKTVSAALPDSLPTTANVSSRVKPMGGLDVKRVVKYLAFYMKPKSATVKVGKSLEFVPYARVLEKEPCQVEDIAGADDLALASLCRPKEVVKEYPFTNTKAGFARTWSVNAVVGGDSTNGTITPKPSVGATYTAPAKVPTPNTVTVSFESTDTQTRQKLVMLANVTISGADYSVVGNFTSVGYPACPSVIGIADLTDHLEFKLAESGNAIGYPYLISSITNQKTENTNFRASSYITGGTVTQNSLSEVLNATKGHAEFKGTFDTLEVIVDGGSWTGGCTLKYPDITFNYPASDTVPAFVSFQFNLNAFNNNTQSVDAADPNGFGTWKFTITRQ